MNRKSRDLVLVSPFGQEEAWGCAWRCTGRRGRERAGRLGRHADKVGLHLRCWGVVAGFKQNDTVGFENHPGTCESTSQPFSEWALRVPSCSVLERTNDGPGTRSTRKGPRNSGLRMAPFLVSFLLMLAFLASHVQVCTLPARLLSALHF